MREFHGRSEFNDLDKLRENQIVTVNEPTIGFDIRLDATDKLDEGDDLAEEFGIAPQLSTLELMVYPKGESMLGAAARVGALLGKEDFNSPAGTQPALDPFHLRPQAGTAGEHQQHEHHRDGVQCRPESDQGDGRGAAHGDRREKASAYLLPTG